MNNNYQRESTYVELSNKVLIVYSACLLYHVLFKIQEMEQHFLNKKLRLNFYTNSYFQNKYFIDIYTMDRIFL